VRDSRVLLGRGSCTNSPDPLQVRPGFGPVGGFAEFIPVPARYLIKVGSAGRAIGRPRLRMKPITPKLVGAKPIKANALDEEKV
jgi:alcohol dehydrogenase, propanol-preferring